MVKFLQVVLVLISLSSSAQISKDCFYIDQNILLINCGKEDRFKISEAVQKISNLDAKVIAIDLIFFDKRPADSIFLKRMTSKTPIILSMGAKNDSSYFAIPNCYNGPHSINGNDRENIEFLFPISQRNEKIRDSFELLVLKHFDSIRYSRLKNHLTSFDLTKYDAKAKIEFNGMSFDCFYSVELTELDKLNETFVKDKIVVLGYFGTEPNKPLRNDRKKYAFRIHDANKKKGKYMYSTLIAANIISNLIRKEINEANLFENQK